MSKCKQCAFLRQECQCAENIKEAKNIWYKRGWQEGRADLRKQFLNVFGLFLGKDDEGCPIVSYDDDNEWKQ